MFSYTLLKNVGNSFQWIQNTNIDIDYRTSNARTRDIEVEEIRKNWGQMDEAGIFSWRTHFFFLKKSKFLLFKKLFSERRCCMFSVFADSPRVYQANESTRINSGQTRKDCTFGFSKLSGQPESYVSSRSLCLHTSQ